MAGRRGEFSVALRAMFYVLIQYHRPNDVFIAVMGVTGAGKSTFISQLAQRPIKIGYSLQACRCTPTTVLPSLIKLVQARNS
jgi:signal recognition particle receptor subunit beta